MSAQPAFLGRLSFVSLELSFPPMMWFARGVELPDMMPVIACITPKGITPKGRRAAVLGGLGHQTGGGLDLRYREIGLRSRAGRRLAKAREIGSRSATWSAEP